MSIFCLVYITIATVKNSPRYGIRVHGIAAPVIYIYVCSNRVFLFIILSQIKVIMSSKLTKTCSHISLSYIDDCRSVIL